MDIKHKFLSGILGKDGAQALKKAAQHDSRLEPVILPRAIIGWLNFISQYEYEGELPGVDNSYIEFTKNDDDTFSGSIAIGEEVHEFENTDIYHVASAISVSIGEDSSEIEGDVRDLVLVRLGKSIDALAKAHEIGRTLASRLNVPEEDLTKAISGIPKGVMTDAGIPGSGGSGETHDYTHVLTPQHKQAGYQIKVVNYGKAQDGSTKLSAELRHKGKEVGVLESYHHPQAGVLEPEVAMMEDAHKGKGLGQSMYEALFAHGYHNGVKQIEGGIHSTDASRVHSKLAGKHGMEYLARPSTNPADPKSPLAAGAGPRGTAFDRAFKPYKYTLKQELPMDKTDLPGKTHAPTKQQGPIGPDAPRKQGKLPKPPTFKAPSLKIGKTESSKVCDVCEGSQFSNNKFTGCICFRDLAKSIKTTAYSDGYALDFKTDFDKEAYMVLSKYFRS